MEYGTELEVTLTVKLPKRADNEQVMSWLKFCLNNSYLLNKTNPLADSEFEAESVEFRVSS